MSNKFLNKLDLEKDLWLKLSILINICERKDAINIIKKIFYDLTNRNYFYYITQYLFDYLICYPLIFKEELLFMLNNADRNHLSINYNAIEIILYNIPEGVPILINNFREFHINSYEKISLLTKFSIEHQEYFEKLLNVVINSQNFDIQHAFFVELVNEKYDFDFNIILDSLRKLEDTSNVSSLPSTLGEFSYRNPKLRDFLVNNFEELMRIEKVKKMSFYCNLKNYLPANIRQKYAYLSQMYMSSSVPHKTEKMLDILLNHQEEDFIKNYIKDKDINYLSEGTTAQCFRIGDDKVLKLSMMKHMRDTITKHFLLAPTEMKIIYDENNKPILYIEEQNFLSKVHNGIPMNDGDLENYFRELKRLNLILTDPLCYRRKFDNFGFLNDYHEATLVGVNNHEELPDWFKKRPVVLFDIDMLTKKLVQKK